MSDDRLKSAAVVAAQAAARARNEMALKGEKKKSRNQKKLENENKFFPTLRALEAVWHRETKGAFPKWGNREMGLAGDLVKRSSAATVEAAFVLAVRYWGQVFAHVMGPKKALGTVSLSFIHRHAETLLMFAKVWASHEDEDAAITALAPLGLKLTPTTTSDLPPGFSF